DVPMTWHSACAPCRMRKPMEMQTLTLAADLTIANMTARVAPHEALVPTLLLVDDHELVRYGVKSLYTDLQGVPLRWLEAGSLQEALSIYAEQPRIDAVLLDLNLADCKGLQGLRRFVHDFPAARIVVFSA